jgi:hypothetical protein
MTGPDREELRRRFTCHPPVGGRPTRFERLHGTAAIARTEAVGGDTLAGDRL